MSMRLRSVLPENLSEASAASTANVFAAKTLLDVVECLCDRAESIAALALGHVHGLVGALEKFLHIGGVLRIYGYANAG